jgi:hypothetical protein
MKPSGTAANLRRNFGSGTFPTNRASSSRSSTNRAEKSTSNLFIPRTIKEPEHEPNGAPHIEQIVVRIKPSTQLPRLRPSSYMLRCSRAVPRHLPLSHLIVGVRGEMVEALNPNEAETRIFHISHDVERDGQGSGKSHHVYPAVACGHTKSSEQ